MRREKGITLVALILTVVVLLILAVVSINAIQDTQIINYTSNAGQAWNNAQRDENGFLQTYNQYLGNYSSTGNSGTTEPSTEVEFTIVMGDVIENYSVVQGTTWKEWIATPPQNNGSWSSYWGIQCFNGGPNGETGIWSLSGVESEDEIQPGRYEMTFSAS